LRHVEVDFDHPGLIPQGGGVGEMAEAGGAAVQLDERQRLDPVGLVLVVR
jgi:hypothetical protein